MIRLNVSMIVETSENRDKLVDKATELVEFSLRDKGCISYDLYKSTTNDDRYLILETWESEEDLKAHMASDHFKRLVPEIEKCSTMTLEKFDF
ncbi:MAG: antibiotic biosynthesis monooxygenase [Muribaculaceae bacterium]|nr:antibiotic biosynthesis monooxygenase [Muribaculaceae bacterium]